MTIQQSRERCRAAAAAVITALDLVLVLDKADLVAVILFRRLRPLRLLLLLLAIQLMAAVEPLLLGLPHPSIMPRLLLVLRMLLLR